MRLREFRSLIICSRLISSILSCAHLASIDLLRQHSKKLCFSQAKGRRHCQEIANHWLAGPARRNRHGQRLESAARQPPGATDNGMIPWLFSSMMAFGYREVSVILALISTYAFPPTGRVTIPVARCTHQTRLSSQNRIRTGRPEAPFKRPALTKNASANSESA
jgi:hypothetical protein